MDDYGGEWGGDACPQPSIDLRLRLHLQVRNTFGLTGPG